MITYEWRGTVADFELDALHADAFDHALVTDSWNHRLDRHSMGWVTARDGHELVGFVNVLGDGGVHAFLIDTMVAAAVRRTGVGTRLVDFAVAQARAGGCAWLHVDFDERHRSFYVDACGFRPTAAGLIKLK